MKLELEQLEDIKSTITWLLENGSFIDLVTSYNSAMNSVNTLDEAINYIRCCKSDSDLLPKYWQIKKELITPELKKRFPSIIEWAFEKDWWINNNIAKEDELEPLSI